MRRLGFLLFCLPLLSGCWDKKELNEVAVIVGVGIDTGHDGTYKVTAQVIKPAPGGGGQQRGSGSELPTWSLAATGDTIMAAINNLNKISPRQLYWAHLQIIVFGEAVAKKGLSPILTWFERDKDSRSGSYVVVTRGTAENLLNKKIELGNISSKSMADLLHGANLRQITARQMKLKDLTNQLVTPGIDPALDVIDPKKIRGKVETYQLAGVAVFKGDKMAGFIKGPTTMGTEIIFDKLQNTLIEGACPHSKKGHFIFQVTNFSNKFNPRLIKGKIHMNLNAVLEGNLSDQSCPVDLLKNHNKQFIKEQVNSALKKYVETEFDQSKKLKADIFGIGREVRRYFPDIWERMGRDKNYLNNVVFDIQIQSNVRRSGLVIEPSEVRQKGMVE